MGDSATKAAIEAKCAPDCVEMEGAAVSQIAAKNGVPCVILRAMSDNADEDGHEVLVVKKFSISRVRRHRDQDRGRYGRIPVTPRIQKQGWRCQPVFCYRNCSNLIRLSSSKSCSFCISRLEPGAASG